MSISNTPEFPTLDYETYYEPPKCLSNADMLLGDDILGIPHLTKLVIFLNGKEIQHFLHFELTQSATTHHSFTLTLAHDSLGIAQDHHMEDAQKLQGKRITAAFQYKDLPNGPCRAFVGIITKVGFSKRKESFGHIILSGYSPTILLDAAVHSQSFGGKQTTNLAIIANNVIKEGIVDRHTCKVRIEPSYTGHLSYSCQYEETHYNFLARTAEAYGEQFFYDGEILHFGKLPLPEKAIKLTHGHDVFHVSVEMKARHVKRSFYGYNSSTHEQLTSPETRIDHQSSLAKSAYEISEKTFLTPSLGVAPIKASTHQDVETSQRGASGSLATTVFTTSGQTRVPFLYPGCLIDLYMRQPSSRDSRYFTQLMVTQITHSVDNLGHYIGYFEAIAAGTGYLPTPKFEMPKTGTQYATVTDNINDQGRVRVRFDWQWDYLTTDWIRVLSPDAGSSEQVPQNRGFVSIPEIGDRVMVRFIHGHPDRPFVAGGIFHGKVAAGGGPGNNIKSWSSKSGHIIELNDAGGITIRDKTGGNQILIDGQHTISLSAIKTIELNNGKSSLKIEGNKISLHANKIEIAGRNGEPASKIAIKALNTLLYGKDSIKIHSDKQVIISSKGLTQVIAKTDLTISGEHTTIRSKAMTNIVGNPINLISTGPQAAPKANAAAPVTTFKIDAKPELASSGMHPQAQTGAIQRTTIDHTEATSSNDLPSAEYTVVHRSFAPWKKFGHFPWVTSENPVLPKLMETDETFYGDNRGFSLKDGASRWDVGKSTARIHQVAKIKLNKDEKDKSFAPTWSSETRGKKNFLGKEDIAFCQPSYKASFVKNKLMLQFEGTDPLVIIAPTIDWKLNFVFDKKIVNGSSFLSISGKIKGKGFPAYECFIADMDNNRIFIHTYACPEKLELAIELGSPRYDYEVEIKLLIEIDENGLFKKQAHSNGKRYTVDVWNEINWKRKPAPDCE